MGENRKFLIPLKGSTPRTPELVLRADTLVLGIKVYNDHFRVEPYRPPPPQRANGRYIVSLGDQRFARHPSDSHIVEPSRLETFPPGWNVLIELPVEREERVGFRPGDERAHSLEYDGLEYYRSECGLEIRYERSRYDDSTAPLGTSFSSGWVTCPKCKELRGTGREWVPFVVQPYEHPKKVAKAKAKAAYKDRAYQRLPTAWDRLDDLDL